MSHFEQTAISNEHKLLKYYTDKANYQQQEQTVQRQFVNLSLSEIASNISATIISIIDELFDPRLKKDYEGLVTIFFKDDRMIYLGITVIILALATMLITLEH